MTKGAGKRDGFWERNRKSGGYLLKKTTLNFAYKIIRMVLLFRSEEHTSELQSHAY